MGITHKHVSYVTTDIYYPSNGDYINPCTGQQTVYYPSNGDYT